ncbi:hypothetical protein CRYUN_Cryun05aG0267000 [Craigia yunnanensis]
MLGVMLHCAMNIKLHLVVGQEAATLASVAYAEVLPMLVKAKVLHRQRNLLELSGTFFAVQRLAEIPIESELSLGHRGHFVYDEQDAMDVNAFHMKSEDTDLFKEHFGNLSAILKVERRQSSTRRRYSSQYFVRRDYFVGCKNFFDKSMQNIGVKESATNVTLDDPVIHEKQVMGFINQICVLVLSRDEKDKDDSSTIEEAMTQKEYVDGESEVVREKITACREALLSLDTAAENVFQLFAKFGTECSMEEFSSGSGAQLYDEVNAVAKVIQNNTTSNVGSSRSRIEGSTFEPLLGTLAESLSQRVVEILKRNLSSV